MSVQNENQGGSIKEASVNLAEAVAQGADEAISEVQNKFSTGIETIKTQVCEAQKCTENYVRDNPWKTIGIALGAGYILGKICSRV